MRENRPSVTALYVTYGRALATRDAVLSRACNDPYAERMLPSALRRLLSSGERGHAGRLLFEVQKALTMGLSHHLALRTALIDRALEHGLASGIDQVVLLGAGFDTRAHRMAALAKATLYELDHPATQRVKRHRAQSLPVAARTLRYAPCDFVRTQLAEALQSAGFDSARPALWVWEGVTMYLPEAAIVATLRSVAQLSAASSLLIATYLTPDIVLSGHTLGRIAGQLLGVISEPLRYTAQPAALSALLGECGFAALSDASPKDAAPHFGIVLGGLDPFMPAERLTVAIRGEINP